MKLRFYLLKRIAILVKLMLFWLTMDGQIYTWGDMNSPNCNHSAVCILEGKSRDLIILGKCSDNDFRNLKIGYSRITADGKVISDIVISEKQGLYHISSFLYQPDGMLRIYSSAILANGMMVPYINIINPENGSLLKYANNSSDPEIFGDIKAINKSEIITLYGRKNITTGNYNLYARRSDMILKSNKEKQVAIDSKFNEEPESLYMLPDTSFYLLGRRDVSRDRSKSFGMIYYISPDFKIKWNMQVLNSEGLSNQCICGGKDGWIYYFSSKKEDEKTSCSSKGFIFEKDGNKLRQIEIDSCFVNTVLTLKNGNIIVAGYKIRRIGLNTVKQAQYIVYDRTLKKIKSRTIDPNVQPDLTSTQINSQPAASEITTAIQLSNGKIVLGGSASMALNMAPDKTVCSVMSSKYMIAVLSPEGYL